MQAASSIYIRTDLKTRLTSLKRHPKESYNDVIERLLTLAVDDEPLSDEAIRGLEESLREVREGTLISEKEIMRKYGVK